MVSSRKRGRQEMEAVDLPQELSMAQRIRNMWEFANLAQWIYTFGKAVKIDENLDIEDLEMECMKIHSTVLSEIGLALLKFVSSHRGLTSEIFDEYTRRQYLAKAPKRNPFGNEEAPAKFAEFDAFTKIRVLQQLTQWTMVNPDRIRERMEEQKDSEQTIWRIEPFGWDSEDRTYIVLDDNRLYRQTAPPPPPPPAPTPKKGSKKAKAALRASKRRKLSEPPASDVELAKEGDMTIETEEYDGFGGMKWECLAVTLDDLNQFLLSIEKSRDPNEKILRSRIAEDLLPLLERQEEARKRKVAQKERELLNLEKLATAKRSSRIAGKLEQHRQEEETKEAERKKLAELTMAKKEQEKWMKLEKERESRMMTREQRLKEREARRILHEEELTGLSEDSKKLEAGESRLSERHLKAEIERKKQALEELAEEDDWVFDCICGAYGHIDDGSHSISCERCNIWQHTKCVGVGEAAANRDDFHFICKTCKRRADEVERPKHRSTIKLKVNRPPSSSSPATSPPSNGIRQSASMSKIESTQSSPEKPGRSSHSSNQRPDYASPYLHTWNVSAKPQTPNAGTSDVVTSPTPKSNVGVKQDVTDPVKWSPNTNGSLSRPQFHSISHSNGGHAFSSPHPHSPISLPPPPQGSNYSFVNGHASSASGVNGAKSLLEPDRPVSSPSRPHSSPEDTFFNRTSGQILPPTPSPQNSQREPNLHGAAAQPTRKAPNGQHQPDGLYHQIQASVRLPSPLSAAPATTPSRHYHESAAAYPSAHVESQATPRESVKLTPMQQSTRPVPVESANLSPAYVSVAAPHRTGISPVKHSPPRLPSANGYAPFGFATPSVLPPVASIPPDHQQPNLTPPIKMAEPERNKLPMPSTTT